MDTIPDHARRRNAANPLLHARVVESLREVYDPEIEVNVYDLGLVYELQATADGCVRAVVTLTSPACPVAEILPYQMEHAILSVEGVSEVDLELTWDPPWNVHMMTEDARLMLAIE